MRTLKLHITFTDGHAEEHECRSDQFLWRINWFSIEGNSAIWMLSDIKEIVIKFL
jgi:hypothetical protein